MFGIRDLQEWLVSLYNNKPLVVIPYAYSVTFTALAPAVTANQSLTITANSDFVLLANYHRANVAAAVQTVSTKTAPLVRCQITDSGTNEQFFNSALDLENFSTNGYSTRYGSWPRWLGGRSALSIQATNYDAAATYNFDLVFSGILVRMR